jgi:hypothetical protein
MHVGRDMTASKSTFELVLRHGIWRVTLEGAFYGDYRSKLQAMEAAESGAQALRDRGHAADVRVPSDDEAAQRRGRHLFWNKPSFAPLRSKWGAK